MTMFRTISDAKLERMRGCWYECCCRKNGEPGFPLGGRIARRSSAGTSRGPAGAVGRHAVPERGTHPTGVRREGREDNAGNWASKAKWSWSTMVRPTGAWNLPKEPAPRVVHQPLRGYGNALRKGFAEARGKYILMADCDESYDLTDLHRFVERLRTGADLVMGNRMRGEIKPGAMPWHRPLDRQPAAQRFF